MRPSRILTLLLIFYTHLVSANNSLELKQRQISEALGHFIWSELKSDQISVSLEAVIEGMRKAAVGTPSPIAKDALHQCLLQLEEEHYNAQALKNLAQAEKFLDDLKGNPQIQILVPKRLYMQILSAGSGVARQNDKPCYHIKCELLNGSELLNTFETGSPVTQDPNVAIRGFKEGIIGMKAGEKRRLYIHPEYGYGTLCHIEPNSLLIVDVELIKKQT